MTEVKVQIVRFTDNHQPGWVQCVLHDAWGREWTFIEKVPIVTTESLDETSPYPYPGVIACRVIRRWRDEAGRELVTIDTEHPYGVESTDGRTRFDVLSGQLTER